MKKIVTRYQVATADSWRVVRSGFYTRLGACEWAQANDWGQYENDGGLIVVAYECAE